MGKKRTTSALSKVLVHWIGETDTLLIDLVADIFLILKNYNF